MSLAFNAIIVLIAVGPVLAFLSSASAIVFQMLLVAIALIAVAADARHLDATQVRRASAGIVWILLLLPLCLLVQILPMPSLLAHPVWSSANDALQTSAFGHISVDTGDTTAALLSVLSVIGLVMVTIVVGRERRRAELILLAASAVATLSGLSVLLQSFKPLAASLASKIPGDVAISLSSVGLVLNLAIMTLAFERRETRHQAAAPFLPIGLAAAVGVLVNAAALLLAGNASSSVVTGFGVALFVMLIVIRRFDLGRWPVMALSSAMIAAAVILAGWLLNTNAGGSTLVRLVPHAGATPQLERMLAEARWIGAGAGTFQDLARIYQDSDVAATIVAPSTAVSWAVEIGWLGLFGAVVMSLVLLTKLFRAALRRGRDWFYSGVAAAAVTITTFGAFLGAGLLHPAVATVLGIVVGLGLSQGISQSARS